VVIFLLEQGLATRFKVVIIKAIKSNPN